MRISFINVGYGDSILIEYDYLGEKFNILIDGGKSETEHYIDFPQRVRAIDYLKEKGICRLNLLVITHLHEDHVGGLLDIVKSIDIDEVWCNYVYQEEFVGRRLENIPGCGEGAASILKALNFYNEICCILKDKNKDIKEINGIKLNKKIAGLLNADIFGPMPEEAERQRKLISTVYSGSTEDSVKKALADLDSFVNNTSIVLRLIYGNKKVLLAGDVYNNYWDRLIDKYIPLSANILKLPHHGHMDGVSEELIKAVSPDYVIVSTSNNRPDNCPNPGIIEMFNKFNRRPHEKYQASFYENGYKTHFLFTDAVHMPPYSTQEMKHKAVVFNLHYSDGVEHEYI